MIIETKNRRSKFSPYKQYQLYIILLISLTCEIDRKIKGAQWLVDYRINKKQIYLNYGVRIYIIEKRDIQYRSHILYIYIFTLRKKFIFYILGKKLSTQRFYFPIDCNFDIYKKIRKTFSINLRFFSVFEKNENEYFFILSPTMFNPFNRFNHF